MWPQLINFCNFGPGMGKAIPWYQTLDVAPVAAYAPKDAANLTDSYKNVLLPGTHNLTLGVAPTFSVDSGWTFSGTEYLKTDIIPTRSYSILVHFSNASGVGIMTGVYGTGISRYLIYPNNGSSSVAYGNTDVKAVSPILTSGNLGMAGQQGYRNGVVDGTAITGNLTNDKAIYIGCNNNNGTAGVFWTGTIHYWIIFDSTLTPAQMLTQANAMQVAFEGT